MALISRYLVIDVLDNILAVRYNREAAFKACAEFRKADKTCGVWCETSILARPEHTQEVRILGFNDPIPGECGS